ncbi:MAG: DUF1080 domain-containing protein [Planctomycetota bacterium]
MARRLMTLTALVALLAFLSVATATNANACKKCEACKAKAATAAEAKHNVAPEGWTALFNGKDIEGWAVKSGFCTYEVKDGVITGTTAKGSGNTFLCTPTEFSDFELKFDTLLHDGGLNSGVQIRSKVVKDHDNKWGGRIGGPQVEIASNGNSGFIYGEASTRRWMTENVKELRHEHFKTGEWNTYHVVAKGNTITTKINGHEIATTVLPDDFQETFAKGVIGLQVHSVRGDPDWKVSWRNIYVKALD